MINVRALATLGLGFGAALLAKLGIGPSTEAPPPTTYIGRTIIFNSYVDKKVLFRSKL